MGGWCERGWEDGMRGAEVGKGLGGASKVERCGGREWTW